jgi:hypothetical protein
MTVMVMVTAMVMVTIHAMRAMVAIFIVIFGKSPGLFCPEALLGTVYVPESVAGAIPSVAAAMCFLRGHWR